MFGAEVGKSHRLSQRHWQHDTTATVTNVDITGNAAVRQGGGLYNEGTLDLSGGTISGNATTGNVAIQDGGGGLYNDSTINTLDAVSILNNVVLGGTNGGGIYNAGTITTTKTVNQIAQHPASSSAMRSPTRAAGTRSLSNAASNEPSQSACGGFEVAST